MFAAPGDGLGLRTLWTDAPDAVFRLAKMLRDGVIDNAERIDLLHFIEHGWLIWRGAIPEALVDALVHDIRSLHTHPGLFVRTNHRGNTSRLAVNDTRPDRFESLFDLYVNLRSAREVCLHPRISRFLSLVFGAKPVIQQQLLFQRSNGHTVHQDTSVVAVEDPLLLAASWIALQDVVEGSGELAFYDQSHKLPHYVFADGSKRIKEGDPVVRKNYTDDLRRACEKAGCRYERFMAKKGDVFFWAADLVHLSHPRTLPEDTARLSCVTHYYPHGATEPFWFRFHPDHRRIRAFGDRGFYASNHYVLTEDDSRMIAPRSPSVG